MTCRIARDRPISDNSGHKTQTAASPHKERVIATKVLILAGDTDGNLGDLAIVTATCESLRSIDPEVRISLLTAHPERDRRRLGIVPLRRGWRGLPRLMKAAWDADLVVCGGGGLFQDDDSLLKMPYWALRLSFLRLISKRMAGLSIGAGPLRHPVSRLFGRLAMKVLNPISVRDSLALDVMQPLTRKSVLVVPDPAFMLQPAPEAEAAKLLRSAGVPMDKPLVGVAVRRWFHTSSNLVPYRHAARLGLRRDQGRAMMSAFNESIAAALNTIVGQLNVHVVFMPTYDTRYENDTAVCNEIATRMVADSCTVVNIDDPKLYKAATGFLSVMLCGRMHAAILAAGQGIPIIGLAYNQKSFGMFSLLGHGARCLSMTQFVWNRESPRLVAMLREAIRQPDQFRPDTSTLEKETFRFLERLVSITGPPPRAETELQTQRN